MKIIISNNGNLLNNSYPFGMGMPTRSWSAAGENYRFGFGGHEKIDEVNGSGNTVDMGDRWLDVRLGRTPKPDAKGHLYPDISLYSYAGNNPIIFKDRDGKTIFIYYETGKYDKSGNPIYSQYEYGSKMEVPNNEYVKQTIAALNNISQVDEVNYPVGDKNPTPSQMLTKLSTDAAVTVNIKQSFEVNMHKGVHATTSDVNFNPYKGREYYSYSTGKKETTANVPPSGGLNHELKHAFTFLYFKTDYLSDLKKRTFAIGADADSKSFPNDEEAYSSLIFDNA